ncbi:protein of unknown function [Xenorhabdus poinarii G6]|uniref:Uncharacterized protein n=1 Tax=Xenorhabdus poinarii G6 TaxID=1354304 RepID=A0A068R2Y4_9GAMM|nr:protein of unknown function [Xenorhabdus poinarii G6]
MLSSYCPYAFYLDKKILDKNQLSYYFNLSSHKDTFFSDIIRFIT